MEQLLEWATQPLATVHYLVESGRTYVLLIPVYGILLLGERIWHQLTEERLWDDRDSAANIAITVAMLIRDLVIGVWAPLAIMAWLYGHFRLFELGYSPLGWIAVFLLYDFTWYIDHRIGHRTGLFWAFHQVHHSSQEYNMTVASRGFLFDSFLTRPLFYLLPIVGVAPEQYITIQIFTNILGIAQHTRLVGRLGFLDDVFATPSNHRVHHGSDPEYLDRNYGEVLILWDRLFGTYTREAHEPRYGLTKNIDTYNPVEIEISGIRWLINQMRSADNWRDRLRYLWKPPGWRHDGTGQTTEDLRAQYFSGPASAVQP